MQTTLIMLPQPILVGRELSKEEAQTTPHFQDFDKRYFEILANIECSPYLDLSLIAERIGWVDVERLAKEYTGEEMTRDDKKLFAILCNYGRKLLSLNEKKYSEADMRNLWNHCNERGLSFLDDEEPQLGTFEEYLQSLSKPKEYNVEVIQEGNTIKVTKIL